MDENFFKFNFIINKFYKWNCKIYSGSIILFYKRSYKIYILDDCPCFINRIIKCRTGLIAKNKWLKALL